MLNKRYTLNEKIGEGGLSIVYDVNDIYAQYFNDNKKLIAKIPSKKIIDKKDISAFVYSEYSLLSALQHENIVKVIDFGIDEESNTPYIIMQKLEGSLLVNIALHEINSKMKYNIISSLYKAIKYIHQQGIIHADINPTNIMILPDGNTKLFDFGISLNINNEDYNFSYTKMNAYNPIYTAPELFENQQPSKKTDIFSLACVLYELYTTKLPFRNSSIELLDNPVKLSQLINIPLLQRIWFKKALSYNPNKRPDTIPLTIRLKSYFKNCIFW